MTALMNFNLKCGNLRDARGVFDEMSERDVVTWTSMIVGYVQNKRFSESLKLFKKMIEFDVIPNGYSFSGALGACSGLQDVKLEMIAWNEMMSSYLQCEQGEEALILFASMVSQGLRPDKFSYSICIDACASLVSIPQGNQVHGCILKTGFQSDLIIRSSLVNMYAKCGCVDSAKLVFDAMPTKDTLLWTTMISAYGKNGQVEEVLAMFEKMLELKINPDGITYLAVLSSCSHGGMVEKGWKYFRLMTEDNLVSAGPEHYSCMVDLLCRSGHLVEALEFIKDMPLRPSISVWCTFLNSCKLYGDIELAQFASDKILELNPQNSSSFVVLSNMHAAEFGWNETEKIRKTMKNDHVKKEPGCSWVELKNGVHVFLTSDKSHPEVCEILLAVKSLMSKGWIDEEHDLENC
ncbi:hypothetical protein MKX03_028239 [Papaver bracteatum]|nr:hypothetical protein MKX03_028239 [Papaver bracteatum]